MIKKTAVLIVLLATSVGAWSQTAFGLKGGLNLSTINLKDAQATYDTRTGYHAGFFLRGRFDKIAIQPEVLLYTQRGDLQSSLIGTAQESFTYVTVPVLFKFYPVGGLNLHAGPQFGFLVDGERKYDTVFGGGTEDITDHYKSSDVAVSAGAGYDFGFGLSVDVRYNIGVKDINNAANGEEAKSRVFMVSLGWNFLK
ncbi:MAG: PorT family protein [Cyclobacteriaceae bacterium]|nr:PorT family protein [Cyclobacteriaceae bacterium]